MDGSSRASEGVHMSKVRAERLVLIIDNDPVLSERLRAVLANYQFKVQLFADGNDLLSGPQLFPELILLSIDPKRLGWALCNRIKKTAQYGSIPMIVTSSEATERDIEEHKKLRTKAEDYLLKPYSIDELLGRVNALIGLHPSEEAEAIDETSIEELSVDDAIVEEEVVSGGGQDAGQLFGDADDDFDEETESAFAALGGPETHSSRTTPLGLRGAGDARLPGLTATISDRAPAVEHSEVSGDGPTRLIPIEGAADSRGSDARSLQQALDVSQKRLQDALAQAAYWHEQRDQLASERDFLFSERERLQRERAEVQREQERVLGERDGIIAERNQLLVEKNALAADKAQLEGRPSEGIALGEAEARWNVERSKLVAERDQILVSFDRMAAEQASRDAERTSVLSEKESVLSEQRRLVTEKDALASDRQRLNEERERLASEQRQLLDERAELEELRQRQGQSAALLRDREVIHLREIINKKDKDILDLRDAADLKERQILDAREKAREQEHKRREAEERFISIEREQLGLQEKLEAVAVDREKFLEREKGLKGRLEDAQKRQLRAEEEIALLRKRLEGEAGRLQAEFSEDKQRLIEQHQQQTTALEAERERLAADHAASLARLRSEIDATLSAERGSFAAIQRTLEEQHRITQANLESQYQQRLSEQIATAESALDNEQRIHNDKLLKLTTERDAAVSALREQVEALRLQGEQQEQRAQDALAQQANEWARKLELSLQAVREAERQREQAITELTQAHTSEISRLRQLHAEQTATQSVENNQKIESLQREQAARLRELEERAQAELVATRTGQQAQYEKLQQLLASEREVLGRQVATLEQQLNELRSRYAATESSLGSLRVRFDETKVELESVRAETQGRAQRESELKAEVASLEQQVQRAYQRLLSDEDQFGRVRRALVIAMAVLDEGQGGGDSPSAQTPLTSDGEEGPSSVTPVTDEPSS